jgi:hypothetical protein
VDERAKVIGFYQPQAQTAFAPVAIGVQPLKLHRMRRIGSAHRPANLQLVNQQSDARSSPTRNCRLPPPASALATSFGALHRSPHQMNQPGNKTALQKRERWRLSFCFVSFSSTVDLFIFQGCPYMHSLFVGETPMATVAL